MKPSTDLVLNSILIIVGDHVHPFITTRVLLDSSIRIELDVTKLKSHQTGMLNMIVVLQQASPVTRSHSIRALCDEAEQEIPIMDTQLTNLWQLCDAIM